MKKAILAAVLCIAMLMSTSTAFALDVNDFQNIFTSGFELSKTGKGIQLSMVSDYGMGYAYKTQSDFDGFTTEFTMDEFPRYDGQKGFGMWYMVGLESEQILSNKDEDKKFWIFGSTGFFLLFIPKEENKMEVAVRYHFADMAKGKLDEPKGQAINLSHKEKIKVIIKKDSLTVNGIKIDVDAAKMQKIYNDLGGKGYPTYGMFNMPAQAKPTSMTILSLGKGQSSAPAANGEVKDTPADSGSDAGSVSDSGSNSVSESGNDSKNGNGNAPANNNPGTADTDYTVYTFVACAAAVMLLAGAVTMFRKRKV